MNEKVRVHLGLWVALVLSAGVAAVFQVRVSLFGGLWGSVFAHAVVDAGNAWLLGTLPVLLAGGFAISLAFCRSRLLLAACLVLGSTAIEVVGYGAWLAFSTSSVTWWREAIYAISSALLAGAWLTARNWGRAGLLASPIAGVASWFAIPHLTAVLYRESEVLWGHGTGGRFVGLFVGYAVEVLVISLPAAALIVLRRVRTARTASTGGPVES